MYQILLITSIVMVVHAEINCKEGLDIKTDFYECCPVQSKEDETELQGFYKDCENSTERCGFRTCVYKQLNALDANGKLDKAGLKNIANKRKLAPELAQLADEVVDECFGKAEDDQCKSHNVADCVMRRTVQKCPSNKLWNQKKLKDCDTIKEFIEKCNI